MPQFNNHVFKENLKNFQENVFGKIFEIPILSNRTVALSGKDKKLGKFQPQVLTKMV